MIQIDVNFLGHGILVMMIFPQIYIGEKQARPQKKKRPNELFVKMFLPQMFGGENIDHGVMGSY